MPKIYPKTIYTFIVADAIREEASKKITILGAMTGNDISIPDPIKFPIAVPLAFVIAFKDGEGEFDGKLRIIDPNGNVMLNDAQLGHVLKKADQTMQFLINFNQLPLLMPGTFKVQILLDDRVYDESFRIRTASSDLSNS